MRRFLRLLLVPLLVAAGSVGSSTRVNAAPRVLPERGMTIWAWDDFAYGPPTAWSDTPAALDAIAGVGANTVALVPTWFQPTATSSAISRDNSKTATDAALRSAVAAARARGLGVTLKPHVDAADGAWRGSIAPVDVEAWFGSYRAMILDHARLAQETGVAQFVVGTELVGVSHHTARWRSLIAEVRAAFRGRVTYAALPFEYARIGFWKELDAIGIDAYWRLTTAPTTDLAVLRAAWAPIVRELEAFSKRLNKPVLFTEAGYTDQVGTTTDPASWNLAPPSAAGEAEQAAAYSALLSSFTGRSWFRGVHWWAWRQTNQPQAGDFTPQGKPAEAVLRTNWLR